MWVTSCDIANYFLVKEARLKLRVYLVGLTITSIVWSKKHHIHESIRCTIKSGEEVELCQEREEFVVEVPVKFTCWSLATFHGNRALNHGLATTH